MANIQLNLTNQASRLTQFQQARGLINTELNNRENIYNRLAEIQPDKLKQFIKDEDKVLLELHRLYKRLDLFFHELRSSADGDL